MTTHVLNNEIFLQLAELYARMENAYDHVARTLNFSCEDCPDNCCDSYFQHHTYIEWTYLFQGLKTLPEERRLFFQNQAENNVRQSAEMLSQGMRPTLMCPLNENGRCSLYSFRLMICRLHGVPSILTFPDGRQISFPGCFRCQELVDRQSNTQFLDRTELYHQLRELEFKFLGSKRHILPKVNLTLSEMIVQGPPSL